LLTILQLFFNNNITIEVEKHWEMSEKHTITQVYLGEICLGLNRDLEK